MQNVLSRDRLTGRSIKSNRRAGVCLTFWLLLWGKTFFVRGLPGVVVDVVSLQGVGKDALQILDSGNRTLAGPTVPPGGLYLTKLWYEDERLNG